MLFLDFFPEVLLCLRSWYLIFVKRIERFNEKGRFPSNSNFWIQSRPNLRTTRRYWMPSETRLGRRYWWLWFKDRRKRACVWVRSECKHTSPGLLYHITWKYWKKRRLSAFTKKELVTFIGWTPEASWSRWKTWRARLISYLNNVRSQLRNHDP